MKIIFLSLFCFSLFSMEQNTIYYAAQTGYSCIAIKYNNRSNLIHVKTNLDYKENKFVLEHVKSFMRGIRGGNDEDYCTEKEYIEAIKDLDKICSLLEEKHKEHKKYIEKNVDLEELKKIEKKMNLKKSKSIVYELIIETKESDKLDILYDSNCALSVAVKLKNEYEQKEVKLKNEYEQKEVKLKNEYEQKEVKLKNEYEKKIKEFEQKIKEMNTSEVINNTKQVHPKNVPSKSNPKNKSNK
jgi:hypothetical protein